jgi:hypothetical protein
MLIPRKYECLSGEKVAYEVGQVSFVDVSITEEVAYAVGEASDNACQKE